MSTSFSRQSLEVGTAGLISLFSAAVIHGSLQLETGWGSTGPQAGYFPLRLAILLLVVGLLLTAHAVWRPVPGVFATGEQLRRVLSQFIPTLALALAAPFTGFYLAAAVFLVYMARVHGGFGWGRALLVGVGAAVVMFCVFEVWFGVPLVRGPLEEFYDTIRSR
ncbi:MAG TPA: tripartite tricarboxylate transporter TctB family protein [Pseudorhodoferax sp.]|nr:tripartite tricarboxylate transporter TctB family protein [Pseudorhodoferax sp.]